MDWLLNNKVVLYVVLYFIVLVILTFVAIILAAFESEHYLNSPFRGGKKIKFNKAVRNYLVSLYTVVIVLTVFWFGVIRLFKEVDPVVKWLLIIGVPILAVGVAIFNSKNEKYLYVKIKDFIEGFLTILTILYVIAGGVGYYYLISGM